MSYNPTNWVNGETPINESNLNHIEQGIKDVADLSDAQESKIADIANNQIPEEYLKSSVDNYIANNQAGLATKTDVNNLDSKLSSEIVDHTNSMENYVLNNSKRDVAIPSGSFGRIEHTNGKYSDYESGNQVACKPFIRLHKGEVYLLKPLDNAIRYNLYFYDENKNFIEAITTNDNMVYNVYQFFSGRNYAYCRIATWKSGNTIETFNSAFELIAFINVHNPLENYQNAINYNNGVYRPFIGTGVIGSEISETTGVFRASTSQNVIASEDFIRMEKGKKYIFSTTRGVIFNLYFYDENKNFISAYSTNSNMSADTKIINNTEYSFVRIGMYKSGATIEDWESFRVVSNEKDLNVVFFGDSTVAGVGTNKTYAMWLAEYYGWTCLNYGIGGTGYLNSMKGANSLAGDGVEGVGATRDITEDSDYLSRVSTLPMNADLYVIGGGYNDWNMSKNIDTFKECAESVYSYILTNNPNAKILVLTPTRQYTNEKDSRNPNTVGKTLEDYANAIKEVCESMSITCIDLYHYGALYPVISNQSTKYFADGLHPNANGDRVIANKIARICEELVGQLI